MVGHDRWSPIITVVDLRFYCKTYKNLYFDFNGKYIWTFLEAHSLHADNVFAPNNFFESSDQDKAWLW